MTVAGEAHAVGVSERFRAAARHAGDGPVEWMPTRLAEMAAHVLQVDGVGLSLLSDPFRVPLGASGPAATVAERLQFTVQQGPCWDALNDDRPLAADEEEIARRWPEFADEALVITPFRSVVSVPLRVARGTGGAVDLYFRDPTAAGIFDTGDATAVAAHIADILNRAADLDLEPGGIVQGPGWARGPAARGRLAVWIAAGMVMSDNDCGAADAVALLRASAYSAGVSVDEITTELLEGRTTVRELLDKDR